MVSTAQLKRRAGEAAVRELRSGMAVGVGTGSTVEAFIDALAAAWPVDRLRSCRFVATSRQTVEALERAGITVDPWRDGFSLDVVVDGADVLTDDLQAIKGFGGALVRERVVFAASATRIVICDATKRRPELGDRLHVPVEVLPFAAGFARRRLAELCDGAPELVRDAVGEPVLSDNDNQTLRGEFRCPGDPRAVAEAIRAIPGVVDHGLFLDLVDRAYVGTEAGVEVVK